MNNKLKVGEIMTTPQRVWYKGAAYHITARGNHRNDIFRDDEDFQYYLKVIEEALLYYGNHNYQLICYCLMDNHVHLMIKTDDKPLISGMAKGIDSYVHTIAINNNNYTIAILGTGVDKCYPKEHTTLMNKIIEKGAVISQFEPGTNNIKENFLKRNELVAMLSDKVVIVQASKDSGALYTATCGLKYNKEVYAVPGTIYDKCNEGTNMLISNGANIYLSPNNILAEFNSVKIEDKQNNCTVLEGMTLSSLGKRSLSLDAIKSILGLTDEKIEELLFEMEIRGDIKQSGGIFTRYANP